nr:MAG TPA: hypothetical protein [Caudoviricetes sp.]
MRIFVRKQVKNFVLCLKKNWKPIIKTSIACAVNTLSEGSLLSREIPSSTCGSTTLMP